MALASLIVGVILYLALCLIIIDLGANESYSKDGETMIFVLAGLSFLFAIPGLVFL